VIKTLIKYISDVYIQMHEPIPNPEYTSGTKDSKESVQSNNKNNNLCFNTSVYMFHIAIISSQNYLKWNMK